MNVCDTLSVKTQISNLIKCSEAVSEDDEGDNGGTGLLSDIHR